MSWELINKIRRTLRISWIKTLYLNFSTLPLYQAFRLPIIVSKYTYFYSLPGKITLTAPVRFGMIRMGFLGEDVVVPKNSRSLLQIEGDLLLGDNVRIGCGVILRIEPEAKLEIQNDVRIGSNCRIIAYESIFIGSNTGISWECQIMDSNMHDICDLTTGTLHPMSKKVVIGANNWIGTRTSIMKGCITPDYTIIGSSSVCNKSYEIPNYSVIVGNPAKCIKTGVKRADYR